MLLHLGLLLHLGPVITLVPSTPPPPPKKNTVTFIINPVPRRSCVNESNIMYIRPGAMCAIRPRTSYRLFLEFWLFALLFRPRHWIGCTASWVCLGGHSKRPGELPMRENTWTSNQTIKWSQIIWMSLSESMPHAIGGPGSVYMDPLETQGRLIL